MLQWKNIPKDGESLLYMDDSTLNMSFLLFLAIFHYITNIQDTFQCVFKKCIIKLRHLKFLHCIQNGLIDHLELFGFFVISPPETLKWPTVHSGQNPRSRGGKFEKVFFFVKIDFFLFSITIVQSKNVKKRLNYDLHPYTTPPPPKKIN